MKSHLKMLQRGRDETKDPALRRNISDVRAGDMILPLRSFCRTPTSSKGYVIIIVIFEAIFSVFLSQRSNVGVTYLIFSQRSCCFLQACCLTAHWISVAFAPHPSFSFFVELSTLFFRDFFFFSSLPSTLWILFSLILFSLLPMLF